MTDTGHLHVHQESACFAFSHALTLLERHNLTAATTAVSMKLFFVWHSGTRSNCQRQTEDGRKTMQLTSVAEYESSVLSCAVMLRTTRCSVNVYPQQADSP